MIDRPEEFGYAWHYGTVEAVYPESWEVDVAAEGGGVVPRAVVLGPRLPEVSTPDRPQWVLWGTGAARAGAAVCLPIASRLPATRTPRQDVVYYDEVLNYRLTVTRTNELEIRNADPDGAQHRVVIKQEGGVVQLDTPRTRLTLRESDQSVTIACDRAVQVSCDTARVEARTRADVVAPDVRLGDPATQQIPLGNALLAWLQTFAGLYNSHLHPHGEPTVGPTGAPVPPPTAGLLSNVSKTR